MRKIYAVASESDVVLAFESRPDAEEYAAEHEGMAVLPVPCVGAYEFPQRAAGDRLGPNRGNAAEGRRAGMRLYVIGPVTGMPGKNRAAFEDARDKLAAMGHRADTPHVLVPDGATWEQAMRISLNRLTQPRRGGAPLYDGVARLPGWRESKGRRSKTRLPARAASGPWTWRTGSTPPRQPQQGPRRTPPCPASTSARSA